MNTATTYRPLCSRCNAETQLSIQNDLYVCQRCGYHAPALDQMHIVLRNSIEALTVTGRPEAREKLQMDQYQANEFVRPHLRSGGVYDRIPGLDPSAPLWARKLWEMIHRCEDEVPDLYEEFV